VTEPAAFKDTDVRRTCMRDRIRDALVSRILDGHYPAGTQLKELALAREFNVSQAPIREALRELEGSGLVKSERYRGTRVRGADLEEMRESYELRATIEARAVELAMPCSPAVIAQLQHCLAQMQAALSGSDVEGYIDQALRLHRCLIEASGNRVFVTVWDSLNFDVRGRLVLRRMAERSSYSPLLQMHVELLEHIRAGNSASAADNLRRIFHRVAEIFRPA
jgi:DNA-binding GntR family transcriptional regulator